ncbi:hypothetical protein [Streptomyces sp. NPDC001500]
MINAPTQLAPVYRALRKAFEGRKNEPGAADFSYGEMEMRRRRRADSRALAVRRSPAWEIFVRSGYFRSSVSRVHGDRAVTGVRFGG